MADNPLSDVTTQILIQIRDEIRDMRASFEARFSAIESRLDSIEARMDAIEARMDAIEARMDRLEEHVRALAKSNEVQHRELFSRINQIDADQKKFAAIVNEAILHYADEMDRVRDRLTRVETRLGIGTGTD